MMNRPVRQSYSGPPMPEQVRSEALSFSTAVLDNFAHLRTIIERWEALIQKRWIKKTREQRKKILLDAWPEMNMMHRPDVSAWKNEYIYQSNTARQDHRTAYFWPHINVEDLVKPNLLLLMLNSRGRNPPTFFAYLTFERIEPLTTDTKHTLQFTCGGAGIKVREDGQSCRLGGRTGYISPSFRIKDYVMMFTDRHTPEKYGELFGFKDHPEAFDEGSLHQGEFSDQGLNILEIQFRLYEFLIKCCKLILHDRTTSELERTVVELEPPPLSRGTSGFACLADSIIESDYCLPTCLNLETLESIVWAKLSSAEDHLWLLREDPGYYTATVTAEREHDLMWLLDSHRRQHPLVTDPDSSDSWVAGIDPVVKWAYHWIEMWSSIHARVLGLQLLMEKHSEDISPSKALPDELELAICIIYHYIENFIESTLNRLLDGFYGSPPVRAFFFRFLDTTGLPRVREKKFGERNQTRQYIFGIFNSLTNRDGLSLSIFIDELARLMEADPIAKGLVSPWVADLLSDVSVLGHILDQILKYQPWSSSFEAKTRLRIDEVMQEFQENDEIIAPMEKTELEEIIKSLGVPTNERFYYPVEKRRTRENTKSMRRAEQNLDMFWEAIDRELAEKGISYPRVHKLLSTRVLERTPEWVETAKPRPNQLSAKPEEALSQLQLSESSVGDTVRKEDLPKAKPKVKTRGIARTSNQEPSEGEGAQEPEPLQQPPRAFELDHRSYGVISTLFFTPSESSQPGEVKWTDFLHVMSKMGFTIEKHWGSAWQFTPTAHTPIVLEGEDGLHGIQFHEPHPSSKFPYVIARRMGRRLSRTYGWSGEMFVSK